MRQALLILLVLSAGAHAQTYEDCRNAIGLFTTDPPGPQSACFDGPPGSLTLYVVAMNPHSWDRNAALGSVGGYELRVILPSGVFLLETTLPPSATNALAPPEFRVTGSLPIVEDQCLLATLLIGTFTQVESYAYLAPPTDGSAVPGHLTILDADDGNAATMAFPISGDYAYPVFGFWPFACHAWQDPWFALCADIVPTRVTAFGALKALYR